MADTSSPEMRCLHRVAGLTLHDKAKSTANREGFSIELLCLCTDSSKQFKLFRSDHRADAENTRGTTDAVEKV